MKQTVVGLFSKSSEAQEAMQQLISNGFSNSDVDLSIGSSDSGTATSNKNFNLGKDEHESGVTKFFKNLFGDDDNTTTGKYSQAATRGNSIVTVHASSSDEAERAADILDQYGAINVDEDADDYDNYNTTVGAAPVGAFNETAGAGASTTDTDTTTGTFDTANTVASADYTNDNSKTAIPIIEEEMQVGKRTVETGGARLRSRIVERPVEESLRLREERVYVNRNPVNRTATSADFDTFKEGEIELREHAEVPVVSKEARVVEEVSLGKEVNERSETVRDTVRKTEVDVEDIVTTNTKTSDTDWNRKDN